MNPYIGSFRISILTKKTDSGSKIVVTDNGRSFNPDETKDPGIALANIRQRLEMMCGGSKMLYSQIVLVKGIPFQPKLPTINHFSAQGITKANFDAELQKGVDSIKGGRTYSVDDIDRMLSEEFDI